MTGEKSDQNRYQRPPTEATSGNLHSSLIERNSGRRAKVEESIVNLRMNHPEFFEIFSDLNPGTQERFMNILWKAIKDVGVEAAITQLENLVREVKREKPN